MALPLTGTESGIVRIALGEDTNDWGSLCTSPKINKWSRRKPYAHPAESTIYGADGTDETIIKNLNFDLGPVVLDPTLIPPLPANEVNYGLWSGWSRPTGGPNEPFRIGDFRGYNHSALPPYGTLTFSNGFGGGKVPVSSDADCMNCYYKAELDLTNADIPLSDINMGQYGNFATSFLTIVAMYRLVGGGYQIFDFAQSGITIAQGVAAGSIAVILQTKTMEAVGISNEYNYNGVVVVVYVASGNVVLPVGTSLKMDSTIKPVVYFDNVSPNTMYAHFTGGVSYDDIPLSGTEISGTISYPRNYPYISGSSMIFDLVRIVPSFGVSGVIKVNIKFPGTMALSRTLTLDSFNAAANANNDFGITTITLTPDEAASGNGLVLEMWPVLNYGLVWTGNTMMNLI